MMLLLQSQWHQCGDDNKPKSYCQCLSPVNMTMPKRVNCHCGERNDLEWFWEDRKCNSIIVSEDKKDVLFYPYFSYGNAAIVRGDTPLRHNYQYYWEVKMMTNAYGTEIAVGLGSDNMDINKLQLMTTSMMNWDGETYALTHKGKVIHKKMVAHNGIGFCKGAIVGVRLDMWNGTLVFYVNRKPEDVVFYNMRRHKLLYPIMSSTAAHSSLRLIVADSWKASLLVDAVRTLNERERKNLPPLLRRFLVDKFWLLMSRRGNDVSIEETCAQNIECRSNQPGFFSYEQYLMDAVD